MIVLRTVKYNLHSIISYFSASGSIQDNHLIAKVFKCLGSWFYLGVFPGNHVARCNILEAPFQVMVYRNILMFTVSDMNTNFSSFSHTNSRIESWMMDSKFPDFFSNFSRYYKYEYKIHSTLSLSFDTSRQTYQHPLHCTKQPPTASAWLSMRLTM